MQAFCKAAPKMSFPPMMHVDEPSGPSGSIALDLSNKSSSPERETKERCECIACIVARLEVPSNARKVMLRHWNRKCRFQSSPSPPLNSDLRTTSFLNHQIDLKIPEDSPAQRLSHGPAESLTSRKDFELTTTTKHVESSRNQDGAEISTHYSESFGDTRELPLVQRVRSSPHRLVGTTDVIPHQSYPFSNRLSSKMRELSVDTWMTQLDSNKRSPPPLTSSPDTVARVTSPASRDDESESKSSSSSAARSPTLLDFPGPLPTDGKEVVYWQRRLRNNLAAKRSRDARRQREDNVAATCQRMEDIKERLLFIRCEYMKLLK